MGKLLRVFVYIILVLSAVALLFANKLYSKREVLTKRTGLLENQIILLAKTIEAQDPAETPAPEIMKDVSEVSDRELANPEKSSLLEGYQAKLEQANLPTIDFSSTEKRKQLRNYYAMNADGTLLLDEVDNQPRNKGPGSMQELLDQVLDRAKVQQATLNKTRSELTKMRDNLSASVDDINKLKVDGRTTKKELKETREQVATLQGEKEELETRVAKLTAEKKELAAEVADAKNEVERVNEEKAAITEELAKAKQDNEKLLERIKQAANNILSTEKVDTVKPSAGDKGKVIEANDELKFAIVELGDDALNELMGPERQNPLPQLEMNVRRTGRQSASGEFVTRIKLRQAVRGKNLVVADILSDWEQVAVEKGDVVFF